MLSNRGPCPVLSVSLSTSKEFGRKFIKYIVVAAHLPYKALRVLIELNSFPVCHSTFRSIDGYYKNNHQPALYSVC